MNAIAAVALFLGAAVWVGGYVTLTVVTRVANRTLTADQRVAFFRILGQVYGRVSAVAFLCLVAGGAVLLRDRRWDALLTSAVIVAAAIVVVTVVVMTRTRATSMIVARRVSTTTSVPRPWAGRVLRLYQSRKHLDTVSERSLVSSSLQSERSRSTLGRATCGDVDPDHDR